MLYGKFVDIKRAGLGGIYFVSCHIAYTHKSLMFVKLEIMRNTTKLDLKLSRTQAHTVERIVRIRLSIKELGLFMWTVEG